jgi:hypothetical protein
VRSWISCCAIGRKLAEATKARLIRRTRGDGGFRRVVRFVVLCVTAFFVVEVEELFLCVAVVPLLSVDEVEVSFSDARAAALYGNSKQEARASPTRT